MILKNAWSNLAYYAEIAESNVNYFYVGAENNCELTYELYVRRFKQTVFALAYIPQ